MDNNDNASVERVPYTFAKRHGLFVAGIDDGHARVIYKNSCNAPALTEIRRYLGLPLTLEQVESSQFENLLQQAYESSVGDMQLAEDLGDELDLQSIAQQLGEPEDLLESEDDAPIIRLINGMLTEAVKENASDVHIEPYESRLRVRFRIDGVLREVLQPARSLAPLIVSRIKVMAKLDIAEKRLPQDGRISLRVAGRPVDVRVSTIPSGFGERLVLRLLDKQAGRLDLDHLGMSAENQTLMNTMINRPNGIILVTGPTGSGKTTTLYAALSRLNQNSRNIMTVEDPVEYHLDGIGQTQVSQKVGMSFARGLRAILRQDPDVVMIGEIRDLETAEIAVQSSLTGHLVLSTLHTNTAVGAMTRMRDMGVEPFLLASTLTGVLAQRLVRMLCPHCKKAYQASAAECKLMNLPDEEAPTLYEPAGCEHCNHLGYEGRTGIYELVEVDADMRTMIHDGVGEHSLEEQARKKSPGMRQDGLRRVLEGVTTLEEVVRVTSSDKDEE